MLQGRALQPDHVLLSPPFAGQRDGLFLCPELYLCACLWLLVQNLCGCLKGALPSLWYLQPVPGLLASHQTLLQCFRIPDSAECLNTSSQWLWPSWLRCRAAKKSKPTHRAWWDLRKNPLSMAAKGKVVAFLAAKVTRNSPFTLGLQKPRLTQYLSCTWQHPGYPRSNPSSTCSE